MNDVHIVTVSTENKFYFDYLKQSCHKNGKELEVLGYRQEWKGFNWKLKLMLEYLNKLNKNDIVCFVDGYDVICVRNLNQLKNTFLNIKTREKCNIIIVRLIDRFIDR